MTFQIQLKWVLSVLFFLPVHISAQGEEGVPEPEPVVVTVAAEALPLSVTSASVTVIDREQIAASGAQSVTELLRMTPSLHISQPGGKGGLATVSIRGAEASFTMVMVDGVPINDITDLMGGAVDLSGLALDNIEKIEIVRGPMSSLYGSEAGGGVIHILSRRGEGSPSVSLSGSLGRFAARDFSAGLSGAERRFEYSLGGSYFDIGEQVENDSFSRGSLSFRGGMTLSDNRLLQVTSRITDLSSESFPENGGGPEFSVLRDPRQTDTTDFVLGSSFDHDVNERWLYALDFGFFHRDYSAETPAVLDALPPGPQSLPSSRGDSSFRRMKLDFSSGFQLASGLRLNTVAGLRNEAGESDFLLAEQIPSRFQTDRNTGSLAAEILWDRGKVSLLAGTRMDKAGGLDAEYSPRIGLTYRVSSTTRFKANWGEGFKLPSFYALSEPNVGNRELKPESSRALDVGIEQRLNEDSTLSLTYFRNSFENLIDFSPELFLLINRQGASTQGGEIELVLRPWNSVPVTGHVTYLDSDIEGSDEPLRDTPRWRGGASLSWTPVEAARIQFENLWVGPRHDFQVPVAERNLVGGYALSNLVLRYRLSSQFEAFLRAENLFDRPFHEFIGFPNPGLFIRAGIQCHFSAR